MRQPPGRRLTAVLIVALGAVLLPALPAQAAATYAGTLAGPSVAAMYPSGFEYDDVNDRLVIADTGLDRVLFYRYSIGATSSFTKTGGFGVHGSGDGQFDTPRDIAIDPTGAIYVADAGNNRVQKFSSTGVFQWARGGTGGCDTCLNTPIGVTWDAANGVLLIASTGQNRIKAFNANGTIAWVSPTGPTLGINAPRDVARGPDGRIWIADYKNHRVKAYAVSPNGQTWATVPGINLGGNGKGLGNLNFPYNMDFSLDGTTVYVSDTGNNRVARWDLTTSPPTPVSPAIGGKCAQAPNPCVDPPADWGFIDTLRRVVVDPVGRLVTADFWGNGAQVWKSTSVGNGTTDAMLLQIELYSPNPQGFAQAFGVAVNRSSGAVYGMDRLNQHLEYYSAAGVFQGSGGSRGTSPGRFSWPEAVTVAPDGQVWAADTRGDRIQRWPANLSTASTIPSWGTTGSGTGQFNYIEDLDAGPDGRIYIADTRNNRIQVFNPTTSAFAPPIGSLGGGNGQFNRPQGVVASATHLFVADTDNHRIQKLTLAGAFVGSYGGQGSGPNQLMQPQGVELAPDGSLWVADSGNHRVVHLSANLENLGHTFGTRGTGNLQFESPHTLAAFGTKLYVADTFNDRVQIVDVSSLGGGGGTDTTPPLAPTITSPTANQTFTSVPVTFSGGATDNVGVGTVEVAIKDRSINQWYRTNGTWGTYQKHPTTLGSPSAPSTTWSHAWTPPASGSGQYAVQVIVTDTSSNVATTKPTRRFNVDVGGGGGTYAPAFRVSNPGGVAPLYPAGGATASNGTRYVADSGGSRVVQISSSGTQSVLSAAATWNDPRDLEIDAADPSVLWVANTSASQIVKLGTNGTIQASFGNVTQPYGLANDTSGIYVANTYANSVVKLSKTNGGVMWTTTGCGGVNFGRPRDVAVGSDGNVYVADTDRNRIARLNPATGACIGSPATFGTTGGNPGQLRAPRALTSDGAGGLWIAEGGSNNRLQHFTNAGAYVANSAIGGFGEGNGQFRSAHCVFMDGAFVAVCDTFNYRIQRFSVNASGVPAFDALIGGTRPADGGFNGAFDVAYGPDGSMYATDWFNHRIQKFNANGTFVDDWGGYGTPNGSYIFPRGIAVRGDGTVVVTDSENNRIDLLQPSGTFIRSFKPVGDTFLRPHQTAIAGDGTYWVADTGKNRLLQLSDNGNGTAAILRTIGNITSPRGVAVDASGNVYVTSGGTVRKIAPGGTSTTLATTGGGDTQVRSPYGLRIVGSGASAQLLIADRGNHRVLVLTLTGQYVTQFGGAGSGDGQFTFPQGMDRNPLTGAIAVADFGNNRLSVWAT